MLENLNLYTGERNLIFFILNVRLNGTKQMHIYSEEGRQEA